jgi:hypothetical protein
MMTTDFDCLRDDLADLPDGFRDDLGPTGKTAIDRALDEGLGFNMYPGEPAERQSL